MNDIAKYLLSIVCVSVILSIGSTFFQKNPVLSSLFQLLSGLCLVITLLAPVKDLSTEIFASGLQMFQQDSDKWVGQGEAYYFQTVEDIIIKETQSYILSKAAALNVYPQVTLSVSDGDPPVPESITITGQVSPYAKKALQKIIAEDIGIAKEDQHWN